MSCSYGATPRWVSPSEPCSTAPAESPSYPASRPGRPCPPTTSTPWSSTSRWPGASRPSTWSGPASTAAWSWSSSPTTTRRRFPPTTPARSSSGRSRSWSCGIWSPPIPPRPGPAPARRVRRQRPRRGLPPRSDPPHLRLRPATQSSRRARPPQSSRAPPRGRRRVLPPPPENRVRVPPRLLRRTVLSSLPLGTVPPPLAPETDLPRRLRGKVTPRRRSRARSGPPTGPARRHPRPPARPGHPRPRPRPGDGEVAATARLPPSPRARPEASREPVAQPLPLDHRPASPSALPDLPHPQRRPAARGPRPRPRTRRRPRIRPHQPPPGDGLRPTPQAGPGSTVASADSFPAGRPNPCRVAAISVRRTSLAKAGSQIRQGHRSTATRQAPALQARPPRHPGRHPRDRSRCRLQIPEPPTTVPARSGQPQQRPPRQVPILDGRRCSAGSPAALEVADPSLRSQSHPPTSDRRPTRHSNQHRSHPRGPHRPPPRFRIGQPNPSSPGRHRTSPGQTRPHPRRHPSRPSRHRPSRHSPRRLRPNRRNQSRPSQQRRSRPNRRQLDQLSPHLSPRPSQHRPPRPSRPRPPRPRRSRTKPPSHRLRRNRPRHHREAVQPPNRRPDPMRGAARPVLPNASGVVHRAPPLLPTARLQSPLPRPPRPSNPASTRRHHRHGVNPKPQPLA
jgi:hypothetical protein